MMPILSSYLGISKNLIPPENEGSNELNFALLCCGVDPDKGSPDKLLNRLKPCKDLKRKCLAAYDFFHSSVDRKIHIFLEANLPMRFLFLQILEAADSENFRILDEIKNSIKYEFDITGRDVLELCPSLKNQVKSILSETKEFWIKSLGQKTRQECMCFIQQIIAKL